MASRAAELDARLDALLLSDPAVLASPFELYEDVRAQGDAYRHGSLVFFTGYDDVREALRGAPGISNAAFRDAAAARAIRDGLDGRQRLAFDQIAAFEANFLSRTDGEQHERLRRIAHRAFTPRAVEAMRGAIQRFTDDALAPIGGREVVDLMETLYHLPLLVVSHMLGVPAEDRHLIHRWSVEISRNKGGAEPAALMVAHEAHGQFQAYVDELVARHRGSPGAGGELVAALIGAEQDERMAPDELAANILILLVAGHETTTNLIAIGTLELLRHPAQWRALVADPGLVPNAVDELLRLVSPVHWVPRFAVEDVVVAGVSVAAGETIVPLIPAANRDARVFSRPHELDVRRPEARQNIAFGFGPHFCLGAALGRLEAGVLLRTLVTRYPWLRLADAELDWTGHAMLRRLVRLPVVLERPSHAIRRGAAVGTGHDSSGEGEP